MQSVGQLRRRKAWLEDQLAIVSRALEVADPVPVPKPKPKSKRAASKKK